ncbi:hypothetical protein OsI_23773 [Oryza sativa Indica Group]|uniref:Uncharacterized protein n=1 Tax=Oryza sativa subsp. indica TaxID=39946 RepID=B8B0E7_ORYSI|nr:hypothetical protein OsI_23773 [Oryza sativa Indica Group]
MASGERARWEAATTGGGKGGGGGGDDTGEENRVAVPKWLWRRRVHLKLHLCRGDLVLIIAYSSLCPVVLSTAVSPQALSLSSETSSAAVPSAPLSPSLFTARDFLVIKMLCTTTFLVAISWQPTVVATCAPRRLATRGPPPPVIPRPPLPGSPRAAAASQPTPAAYRRRHLELPPPISLRAGPQPDDAAAIACCPRHRVPPTAAFAACRHDRGPSPSAVTAYCRRRDSAAACCHRHRHRRCYHSRPFEGGWGRRENGRRWDRKG